MTDPLVICINEFDSDGDMIPGPPRQVSISVEGVEDVVNQAVQLALVQRAGGDIGEVLAELEEALSSRDLLPTLAPAPASGR